MTMNMCIVMYMNIYMTKDNEDFLKKIKPEKSMSGLVNKLLDDYRGLTSGVDDAAEISVDSEWIKPTRATVQPKVLDNIRQPDVQDPTKPFQPIKTKEDVLPAIKQLFPDAGMVTPLYRDKKNKRL